jgi:DNA-binding transcriptional ArsR family regulator
MPMNAGSLRGKASEVARLLELMANERRLMILCELGSGERSVGELMSVIDLSQSALSQHLAKLRAEGLVATRRVSQTIYYHLASARAAAIIETLTRLYCPTRSPRDRQ